jgi:curved DNA-binding protein
MQSSSFIDLYEILQVSPNADPETIHRVYRILAQRFHPDNQETGSAETFRKISDAYRELSDPEQRAAFDVKHREARKITWKIFDQTNSGQGVEAERRKRHGIISLLYRRRVGQPEQGFIVIKEFEELLGVPREHLEFALWYLKEGQFVSRTDNGRYSITLKGIDLAESMADRREGTQGIIPVGSRAA